MKITAKYIKKGRFSGRSVILNGGPFHDYESSPSSLRELAKLLERVAVQCDEKASGLSMAINAVTFCSSDEVTE